ncbi:MAG: metallophosphoesterase [Prevotellaceae bacterium]|jgi:predicted MPP superfamily phosphohydrolase|nr:metallophosphoesterase [Prevotellaceae bacterium]
MRFIFILALMLLSYVGANVYLFARGFQSLPWTGARAVFAVLFVFAAVSLIAGFLLEDSLPATLVSVVQHVGGTWLMLLIYLVPCVLIIDLIRLGDKLLHFLPDAVRSNPATVFFGIFAATIAVVVAGAVKFNNPSVTRVEIPTNKQIAKVPSIVVASDLHLGYTIGAGKLRDFVRLINSRNPDVVLLCGDVVDRSARPLESEEMLSLLREIKAPGGVYAVFGNHEYYGDRDRNAKLLEKAGIVLLRDSAVQLTGDIQLVGREDRSNRERKALSEIMQGVDRGVDRDKFVILLDHQPHDLDEARREGVDLQFSGHTHYGQIWPLSLITEAIYEKPYGYLKKGETQYFVTSGLGLWGAWLRIGTCSEIVVPEIVVNNSIKQ